MMKSMPQPNNYSTRSLDDTFGDIQNNYNPQPLTQKMPFYKNTLFIVAVFLFILVLIGLFIYYKKMMDKKTEDESSSNSNSSSNKNDTIEAYVGGEVGTEKYVILDMDDKNISEGKTAIKLNDSIPLDSYKIIFELVKGGKKWKIKFTNDGTSGVDRNLRLYNKVKVNGNDMAISSVNKSINTGLTANDKGWYQLQWGTTYEVTMS